MEGEAAPRVLADKTFRLPDPLTDNEVAWSSLRLTKGDKLENVYVVGLDGAKVKLEDAIPSRGRVLVNFWASWCGSCRSEMKDLERMHRAHGTRLRIVGLSLDEVRKRDRAVAMVRELGVTYATYGTSLNDFERLFEPHAGIPVSLLVDDGRVVDVAVGVSWPSRKRLAQWVRDAPSPAVEPKIRPSDKRSGSTPPDRAP